MGFQGGSVLWIPPEGPVSRPEECVALTAQRLSEAEVGEWQSVQKSIEYVEYTPRLIC